MVSNTRSAQAQNSTPFPNGSNGSHEVPSPEIADHLQDTMTEDNDDDDRYQAIDGDSFSVTNDSTVEPDILPPAVVLPTYAEVVGHSLGPSSQSIRSSDPPSSG